MVTGGAGFLGSHLCERLIERGDEVLCVDNFYTGRRANVAGLLQHPRFELTRHDITFPLYVEVDEIYNLACPASPIHYQFDAVQTTKTNVHGSINVLGLAKRVKARIFQASTSEVYGDPEIHPQHERYAEVLGPMNLGSEAEITIAELAETVIDLTGSRSQLKRLPLPADDPVQRRPDISFARSELNWAPQTSLKDGLRRTIDYFEDLLRTIPEDAIGSPR
jgi:nucleoside-diphosphate-sugar epimerase